MEKEITRRSSLKTLSAATAALTAAATPAQDAAASTNSVSGTGPASDRVDRWFRTPDRVWLGEAFWANPMEDWCIAGGWAECRSPAGGRSVHLLTHQLTDPSGPFDMSVRVERTKAGQHGGGAGFRIGIRSDINEYRSNCFARGGIVAGLAGGRLVLGPKQQETRESPVPADVIIRLQGTSRNDRCLLTLTAAEPQTGRIIGRLDHSFARRDLLGNIALAGNFGLSEKNRRGSLFRFRDWHVSGKAFTVNPDHRFGPLLWSMYSLSDSRTDEGFVLKLSVLTAPLGTPDRQEIELYALQNGRRVLLGTARPDPDSWTATWRMARWNARRTVPFQAVWRETHLDGSATEFQWDGTIRAVPEGRPLKMAALTCQNDYAFPYEPVVDNLRRIDPDLLYFSGDQLYENHGGFGIIREPADRAILNYLRKFYQFGWAFRDVMRDRPTLCIPDDHDVFQGNLWGESGRRMQGGDTSSQGGYREAARMVNVVHRTNTAHHPDPADPTPVEQGISAYYGQMVYGGVGFAIIADRQWKSGPEHVQTGQGRADHVEDPDFDTRTLDHPGLNLLGKRQENFLRNWVRDWGGHSIKVVLSQTVFAGMATHHGRFDGYLKADLDSGGWPQTARNNAIRILKDAMPLHINGDQHLTSLVQYGIDRQRDGNWSFCTPAIAVGYPRWWRPDERGIPHANRPRHGLPHTGEYVDGLGNRVYVYAVGNPEVPTKKNRYERAHEKGSGFGIVTIDPHRKTYRVDAFRFLVDATDGRTENQFPGWPVEIDVQGRILPLSPETSA